MFEVVRWQSQSGIVLTCRLISGISHRIHVIRAWTWSPIYRAPRLRRGLAAMVEPVVDSCGQPAPLRKFSHSLMIAPPEQYQGTLSSWNRMSLSYPRAPKIDGNAPFHGCDALAAFRTAVLSQSVTLDPPLVSNPRGAAPNLVLQYEPGPESGTAYDLSWKCERFHSQIRRSLLNPEGRQCQYHGGLSEVHELCH